MLSALIRLVRRPWTLAVFCFSRLWGRLLPFITSIAPKPSNAGDDESHAPGGNGPDSETLEANPEEFPLTDDQRYYARKAFIESIDPGALCALASKFHDGKSCRIVGKESGSFNVCFFVAFGQEDGPEWVVRIPLEPALKDPWTKVLSEVATLRYLQRNTTIPLPRIHAYGCDADLIKGGTGTQVFLITDFISGRPLERKILDEASEEHRKNLYYGVIDVLVELRRLEFPLIGSLMPNPNGSPDPILGPVISISAATLGLSPPQQPFTSANDYMTHQFGLVSRLFSEPVRDLTIDDIKQEVFALYGLEPMFHQVIDPQLDKGPFVLNHMDLRCANIIVDKSLQIQGIVDWEFAGTVPRQVFTPPSWITGHDAEKPKKQWHAEFRRVLDEKSRSNSGYDQLRKEWYEQLGAGKSEDVAPTDRAFCVAHLLRRPTEATDVFFDFFAQIPEENIDAVMTAFFDNHESLASEAQRHADQCERYAQFLKANGLYETELEKWLAEGEKLRAKWGWSK